MEDKIDSKAKQLAVGDMFDKKKLKEKPVKVEVKEKRERKMLRKWN